MGNIMIQPYYFMSHKLLNNNILPHYQPSLMHLILIEE